MFIEIIKNDDYLVRTDKINNKWWVELIEIKTGMAQTLIAETKEIALSILKGMTIAQVIRFYDKTMKIEKQKVYSSCPF